MEKLYRNRPLSELKNNKNDSRFLQDSLLDLENKLLSTEYNS